MIAAAAQRMCSACGEQPIRGRNNHSGLCRRCQQRDKQRRTCGYRNPYGTTWSVPPPSVDPTREARIMRYQARVEAGLPLFG